MNDIQKKHKEILDQINALESEIQKYRAVVPLGPDNKGVGYTMEEFAKAERARKKKEELDKELFELYENKK